LVFVLKIVCKKPETVSHGFSSTDNERELAWRRRKEKGDDFCLIKREKKKINFQNSIQKDRYIRTRESRIKNESSRVSVDT
jgi:hypothetical protein